MSRPKVPSASWLPKLVVAPSFLLSFFFIYGLIAWNGYLSLSASHMLPNYEFVGFSNYADLFDNDRFHVALKNMGIFGVLFIGGSMVLGLLLAILLDQKIRGEGVLRTIYLYPMAISFIVTGTAWKWILNPGLGLEHLVQSWGFTNFQFDWLVDAEHAIYCIVDRRHLAGLGLRHGAVPGRPARHRRLDHQGGADRRREPAAHLLAHRRADRCGRCSSAR